MSIINLDIDDQTSIKINKNDILIFNLKLDNDQIKEYMLDWKNIHKKSLGGSVIGGWHSPNILFDKIKKENKSEHSLLKLENIILNITNKIIKHPKIGLSWGNISKKNCSNSNHVHRRTNLIACYYVNISENLGGELIINGILNNLRSKPIRIKPKIGMLIIFSGNMYHQVSPYKGDDERISIVCNIN